MPETKLIPNCSRLFRIIRMNFNEYYTYKGPDSSIALNTFRVDSPMKGNYSSADETILSFQLITINSERQTMTVRECLWNSDPNHPDKCVRWVTSKTISLVCE